MMNINPTMLPFCFPNLQQSHHRPAGFPSSLRLYQQQQQHKVVAGGESGLFFLPPPLSAAATLNGGVAVIIPPSPYLSAPTTSSSSLTHHQPQVFSPMYLATRPMPTVAPMQTSRSFKDINENNNSADQWKKIGFLGAAFEAGLGNNAPSLKRMNRNLREEKDTEPANFSPNKKLLVTSSIAREKEESNSEEDDEVESAKTKSPKSANESPSQEKNTVSGILPSTLQGDRRLIIDFESFGSKGECPQRFGKSGLLIPDGMIGTHTVYQERWRFEIHHTAQAVPGSDAVCITWKIINVKTGFCLAKTETPEEAEARVSLGWTISSRLFREALTHRANELEGLLNGETNQCRIANLKSLIKALRPKTFTQGPLVFGLKHKIVQEKIGNALI